MQNAAGQKASFTFWPAAKSNGTHICNFPGFNRCVNLHAEMKAYFPFSLVVLALMIPAFAHAQAAPPQFKPGEWQIDSTVTPAVGHPVHRTVDVCAKSAGQAWQTSTANQTCSAPALTPITGGYTITLSCTGGAGPVQWKSSSTVHEIFSDGGASFQATGKTTTTVSYAGHAPMTTSATMQSTGKRTGPCK
jgi:hypothetical protein